VEERRVGREDWEWVAWRTIFDCHVGGTAQYKVGTVAKQGNAVEDVLHRADVSAFTDRSVNAEHY